MDTRAPVEADLGDPPPPHELQRIHSRDRVMFLGSGVALFLAVVLGLAREQGWGTRFTTYHLLIDSAVSSGQEIHCRPSHRPGGQPHAAERRQRSG